MEKGNFCLKCGIKLWLIVVFCQRIIMNFCSSFAERKQKLDEIIRFEKVTDLCLWIWIFGLDKNSTYNFNYPSYSIRYFAWYFSNQPEVSIDFYLERQIITVLKYRQSWSVESFELIVQSNTTKQFDPTGDAELAAQLLNAADIIIFYRNNFSLCAEEACGKSQISEEYLARI